MRKEQSGTYFHYFISKDKNTAEALKETFEALWSQDDKNKNLDIDAKLGRLLGYPETAIEYVRAGKPKDVTESQRRPDVLVVHDPAHFEEEYEAYEKPIYEIMDESCPELSAVRKRHKERHFGGRILKLFGRK